MGQLIAHKDWSKTTLGPIESWPQSLRTTVSLSLASNFPINIIWGPGRNQLYNDGYKPICGEKHPHSMGQDYKECWLSAWEAVGPPYEKAAAGETSYIENERMFLDRNGYLEETFFTYSLSPIRDEKGQVAGLFHPVTEVTVQQLAERRLKVVRELADGTAEEKSVEEACVAIAQALAPHALDLPFLLVYLLDEEGKQATLTTRVGLEASTALSPPVVDLRQEQPTTWPLLEVVRRGKLELPDLAQRFGAFTCGPYPESPHTALLLPILLPGVDHPFGVLIAGVSARRALDEPYRTFYRMLETGVTNALANARAYQQERKRAEALAELDRAKTTFFSNVSHEFRTPLTLMLGPLEDALSQGASTLAGPVREDFTVAHRNALRLLKLVNTMLDFSRIESGRIQACYEPVDLSGLTTELASVFRSAMEKAGLQLVIDCPPLPQTAWVDREMWEKIVLNLLSNAFKFTFQGQILVRLREEGRLVQLSVSDTGTGIPAEELPHLFERFHRVPGALSRSHEGSGIGLALVQELVHLHGGTIRASSVVGTGTTFTLTLPQGNAHLPADHLSAPRGLPSTATGGKLFVEEALRWLPTPQMPGKERSVQEEPPGLGLAPPEPRLGADQSLTEAKPARVLLVDDNADMRQYVKRLLARYYQIETADDGLAALQAALAHPPDLVLTDIMMPRLDGLALLQALRNDARTRETPVILLSARAGEESKVEGLEAGADDYLIKPFTARELLARVKAHLGLAQARRWASQVLQQSETRLAYLVKLSDALKELTDSVQIQQVAARVLGEQLSANRVSYAWLAPTHPQAEMGAGWSDSGEAIQEGDGPQLASYPTLAAALSRGDPFVEPDVAASEQLTGQERAAFLSRQIGALVLLPLRKAGTVTAQLLVSTKQPRPWTLLDLALLHETAQRTWSVVERAKAEAALRESEEQFRLLVTASSDSVYKMSPDWQVMHLLQGKTFLLDTTRSSRSWLEQYIPPEEQPRVQAAIERAIGTKSVFALEHRVIQADGTIGWTFSRAIPKLDAEGRISHWIGAASDITLRKRAEHQLLQVRLAQQQELLNAILEAQEEERRRISESLHNGVGQILYATKLNLERVDYQALPASDGELREALDTAEQLLTEAIVETRRVSHELVPRLLKDFGLEKAVTDFCQRLGGGPLCLHCRVAGIPGRLEPHLELALYRISQELVNNIVKHAGATQADLRLEKRGGEIWLEASDNGKGFDPGQVRQKDIGLKTMQDRVALLGGTLSLTSGQGQGTQVTIRVPAPASDH